jgi:hypothetical protein
MIIKKQMKKNVSVKNTPIWIFVPILDRPAGESLILFYKGSI